MKNLSAIAKNDQDVIQKLQSDGLFITGERFILLKADGESAYARAV